eukprot:m.63544 g.63544  ORF g.63544 m.63544 type:complete len:276 (-) comp15840_c2_seq7:195-1022(-)
MNSAKMDPALVASSAPKEIQISELNAAADLLGNDALDEDFREAVNYIMTNADAGSHLSEEQQERLYGLFRVATATKKAPAEFDAERYEHKEQWKAHVAVGDLSKEQAKLMYCDLIATAIPSFLMRDDDEMTSDGENEPAMERESCPEDNGSDLHAIISSGNLSQVQEYLTKRGQDINLRDGRGLTPLMVACDRDHGDIVRYLATVPGVNVNATDEDNQTALHYAVIIGNADAAKALVDANADISAKDSDGADALSIAREDSLVELISVLEATLKT